MLSPPFILTAISQPEVVKGMDLIGWNGQTLKAKGRQQVVSLAACVNCRKIFEGFENIWIDEAEM